MSLRDAYIDYLETKIKPLIALKSPENITSDYHDEFSYSDSLPDVDITVKYLTGQIQTGITQYPGELLILINEKYKDSVIEALTDFTETYNENVASIDSKSYREYYNTPNVIGTFQNGGIDRYTSVSISFSLITFNNVIGLDPNGLTLCYNGSPTPNSERETIKWLTFAVSYAADGTSNKGLNGDNYAKETIDKGAITYTLSFVPKTSSNTKHITTRNLLFQAITGKYTGLSEQAIQTNQRYELGLKMGDLFGSNNAMFTCMCVVKSATFTQESNALPVLQITLTRGDF